MATKSEAGERLPPIFETHRETVRVFLVKCLEGVERSIDAHTELMKTAPTEVLRGQLAWDKSRAKTLRWLIALNKQRRSHG